MIFGCTLKEGKLLIKRSKEFSEYCNTLIGKDLILILQEREKIRSIIQNKYYWGVIIKKLSEYTGYEKEDIHIILKGKFLPKNIIFFGEEITIGNSTKKLTTKEFKEYIEKIQRWASTQDIYIPDPNEYEI